MPKTLFLSDSHPVLRAVAAVFGDEIAVRDGQDNPRAYMVLARNLLEMPLPEELNSSWGKPWAYDRLPMVPGSLRPDVSPTAKAQLDAALDIILDPDVDRIVIAARPGHAATLFFDDLFALIPDELDIWRLWPASLHPNDIRRALRNPLPMASFEKQARRLVAARELEWLVRQNLSRLCSMASGELMPMFLAGTPLLALCHDLAQEKTAAYVKATFHEGTYFEAYLADANGERTPIEDQAELDLILAKSSRQPFEVLEADTQEVEDTPPPLFDLGSLQAVASTRLGLRPQQTFEAAVALYEQGLVTWPGTASRWLRPERVDAVPGILMAIHVHELEKVDAIMGAKAGTDRARNFVSEVAPDGHEAVIPTPIPADLANLSDAERGVYLLVAERFATSLLPPGSASRTTLLLHSGGYRFVATVTNCIEPGWKSFGDEQEGQGRVTVEPGACIVPMELMPVKASPDLSDATLLEALERRGYGTPESRGEALAWLMVHGFARAGQRGSLLLNDKGRVAMATLRKYAGAAPGLRLFMGMDTAFELARRFADLFVAGRADQARDHVRHLLATARDEVRAAVSLRRPCPLCGSRMLITSTGYACENWSGKSKGSCPVNIRGQVMDQEVPPEVMEELLADGISVSKLSFVSKRTGNPYEARVALDDKVWRVTLFFDKPRGDNLVGEGLSGATPS
jgi:DNA topoisomerase IA